MSIIMVVPKADRWQLKIRGRLSADTLTVVGLHGFNYQSRRMIVYTTLWELFCSSLYRTSMVSLSTEINMAGLNSLTLNPIKGAPSEAKSLYPTARLKRLVLSTVRNLAKVPRFPLQYRVSNIAKEGLHGRD